MICSTCGFENRKGAKFCGKCGNALVYEVSPMWKWGSMIASLGIVIFWWYLGFDAYHDEINFVHSVWGLFAIPTIVYLMYKERTEQKNYVTTWTLIVSALWIWDSFIWSDMIVGLFLTVPAFVIDAIYVYKKQ